MSKQAFVLRIAPSRIDRVPDALKEDQIIIGWANAGALLDQTLTWDPFREILRVAYYVNEPSLRKAGSAAGNMWRFIREMNNGDLVVVPYGNQFYIAQVDGPATYDSTRIADDTAFRRRVKWLNEKNPIPRNVAKSALISRMKTQGTCAYATDLLADIEESLQAVATNRTPTFHNDLQTRLVKETLDELRSGRMDSFGFEKLINAVLVSLGAEDSRIVPRKQDKGADVLATFRVAGAFRQVVAVQAKHWKPDPPVGRDVVEQLIRGIEAESADLGMVITTGAISEDASLTAEQYYDDKGIKIELIDGEQFAKLIIEHGIRTSQQHSGAYRR